MSGLRINASHTHAERGLDCYWTPPEATRALMRIERLPKSIADPCCGTGAILDVLKASGHIVYGSDIVNYGWPHAVVRDYLAEPVEMNGVAIVTNPPFRLAEKFIRKAIAEGCGYHAWLLRTNFLESIGRLPLWRDHPPNRVWFSSRRLPMMHREGWAGPRATSNQAFAWFVWDGSQEKRRFGHFDWRPAP
jgi:hypothetical protein